MTNSKISEWQQCSCITLSELPDLEKEICNAHIDEKGVYIILTHSCSIGIDDFEKEPSAEYILAMPIEHENNGLVGRKNPRKLHLEIESNNVNKWYELVVHKRGFFNRRVLCSASPSNIYKLSDKNSNTLIRWIVDRYDAPAFPDAFNRRFKKVESLIAKKIGQPYITGFYIAIEQKDELPEDNEYDASFLITTDINMKRSEIENCEKIQTEVSDILSKCSGISLEGSVMVLQENQVSVASLREMELMLFDYLSERSVPGGRFPSRN